MKRPKPLDLDLQLEKHWAEVILASQDMMQVLMLLHGVLSKHKQDDPNTFQASVPIVTTYCRPFTKNNRRVIHGKRWIGSFNAEELSLHGRVLRIRGTDIAHTAHRSGRVQIHIEKVLPGEIQYSTQYKLEGLMLAELRVLLGMVDKLRQEIESERQQLGQALLAARVAAGYREWFIPGKRGHPDDGRR